MAKTKDEALALVHVLTKGPPLIHFEAVLGRGNTPTAADFETDTPTAIARCEEFVANLEEHLAALGALVAQQRVKYAKRKEASKKNTIPGIPSEVEEEEKLAGKLEKERRKVER